MMKVSAIMPTYNQSEYLEEALNSVVPEVDEVVVVNDGSTDETGEILSHWKDRVLVIDLPENCGSAVAINSGFEACSHDLVTWVSSDNVHRKGWAQRMASEFADDVDVVYSAFEHSGRKLFTPYQRDALVRTLNCYFGPSFLIRREVWKAVGGHRGKISHDYDHWLRVEEMVWHRGHRIVAIPDDLCFYRVHPKRATVVRKHQFDAAEWQAQALTRRCH